MIHVRRPNPESRTKRHTAEDPQPHLRRAAHERRRISHGGTDCRRHWAFQEDDAAISE